MFRLCHRTLSQRLLRKFSLPFTSVRYARRKSTNKPREEELQSKRISEEIKSAKGRDKSRINIVDESLCNDVIKSLRPSLDKHKNCDIIDVNPGAGLWSAALHEAINPRTHILMEPEAKTYMRFLQPLLDQDKSKYKLFPGSGIVWENIKKLETENYLPHQKLLPRGDPRLEKPNDSLLFVANLGYYPGKAYQGFSSVTTLMLYQLMTAIRAHSLFQGYGLVRMLVWMHDKEKIAVLPRMTSLRKKSSVEAEISCENIFEIAGSDESHSISRRERIIDLESAKVVAKKMLETKTVTPEARKGALENAITKPTDTLSDFVGDVTAPFYKELEELEKRLADGACANSSPSDLTSTISHTKFKGARGPEYRRLKYLRGRLANANIKTSTIEKMLLDYEHISDRLTNLQEFGGSGTREDEGELRRLMSEWKSRLDRLPVNNAKTLTLRIDDRRAFRQNPPILLWDRREAEPLIVDDRDFLPQQKMCLLDFHPKSVWDVLRGKNITNYDSFEYVVSNLFITPSQRVTDGLQSLAPGAAEWIIPKCPSFTNPSTGGVLDVDRLSVRTLNQAMLREITEAWVDWPFRPTKAEMFWRMGANGFGDPSLDDDETLGVFSA